MTQFLRFFSFTLISIGIFSFISPFSIISSERIASSLIPTHQKFAKKKKNKPMKRVEIDAIETTNLPEPYNLINILPEDPFGHYVNQKEIADIFEKNNIQIAIEIGSWIGGGSTRDFATRLKKRGGILYSVDTWLGNEEQQIGQVWYQPILSQVYQQFLSNMIHWGLTSTVIPMKMTSLEASHLLLVKPDLIYIDGDHTTEAVYEDLTAWYPFVKNQGILCGDDWTWPSVRIAVEQFATENNLSIESTYNFWRLH